MREKRFRPILIATKLNRLEMTSSRWVPRPRLVTRLEENLAKRVTLISAPAGYGKSTLAAQCLEQSHLPSAWLSLDKCDSNVEHFLRYVIAAVRTIVPEFGFDIEHLLLSAQLPPPDYLADIMISELAEIDEPLLLVLDDYHTIESKAVQAMVIRMVQHQNDGMHLIITTRVDPPWPLALWRSREWLNEIRAFDLLFSKDEMQAFFAPSLKNQLTIETLDILYRRTEGWVAALHLAQLSFANTPSADRLARKFSDSDYLVMDFLMEEVISQQPAEILEFLTATAVVDRFCPAMCDHILADSPGQIDSRRLIREIEKKNLFLVSLDRDRNWYRYHHLFKNLLTQQFKKHLTSQRKAVLHRRAAQWLADHKMFEDAIEQFLVGGDTDAAVALVHENLHSIIDDDFSRRILGSWLAIFPQSVIQYHPILIVADVYLRAFHWDLQGMRQRLDHAEGLLENNAPALTSERRRILKTDIDVLRAFCLYWLGDVETALQRALRALSVVPKKHRFAQHLAIVYAAIGYAICGRRNEGLKILSEALAEDVATGSRNVSQFLAARAAIEYWAGNLEAMEQNANEILTVHEKVPVPDYFYGYAHYFLGSVAYERNLLDTAADHFQRVEQMRYRVSTRLYHDVMIGLALVAWAKGEKVRAREYADTSRSFAIEMNDPYSMQIYNSFKIRLAFLSDEFTDSPMEVSPTIIDSNKFWLETPSLTRAEYHVRKDTPADCRMANRLIKEALQRLQAHHNTPQMIQFLALKAVALHCSGRKEEALQVLEKSLRLAEPLGFRRTFVNRGPRMAELLKVLLARKPHDTYLRRLLDGFDVVKAKSETCYAVPQVAVSDKPNLELLSNREIDVLVLLAERLSNKEIAERLFVSPDTVKKHSINIYRKLGVNDRRQAVVTARRLGILPLK